MNNLFGKVTLGADPEILVMNSNFLPVGARVLGMVGNKENPFLVQGGAVQVDGMAFEYNIDPASDLEQWMQNHNLVQKQALEMMYDNTKLSDKSLLDYSEFIDSGVAIESDTEFGCSPDYNADTMEENIMPPNDGKIKFRTAGGHIHFGFEHWGTLSKGCEHQMAQCVVQVLDATLGLWSIMFDHKGNERRALYGNAGAYRIKPYGVEYRTLSNFWCLDDGYLRRVYEMSVAIFESDAIFVALSEFAIDNRVEIVEAINTGDKDKALALLENMTELYKYGE